MAAWLSGEAFDSPRGSTMRVAKTGGSSGMGIFMVLKNQ